MTLILGHNPMAAMGGAGAMPGMGGAPQQPPPGTITLSQAEADAIA